jgi:hypothetical protein
VRIPWPRRERIEIREWRIEIGDWRLEIGDWKLEIGNWKLRVLTIQTNPPIFQCSDDPTIQ